MIEYKPTVLISTDKNVGRKALRLLSFLAPKSVVNGRKRRLGRDGDGGYVMLDAFAGSEPVYSLGVGGDVSFDADFARAGHDVYQYDHTVDGPPEAHPRFFFHKRAIDTGSGRLDAIVQENGHGDRDDLILCIDIEGDELKVIPACPPQTLLRFKHIVMELHRVACVDDESVYEAIVATLTALRKGHELIHVHANNWGWYGLMGGVPIPDTWELTWVRRADYVFEQCSESFPTELDRPCNPEVADYHIGRLGVADASF